MGQDCFYSSPTVIQSKDELSISIDVSGLSNDDLSASQGICGIRLFFNHGQVENVRMILTSPSGQMITLIGAGTINSRLTSFIDWNILFVPNATPAVPDTGFTDVWDNDQDWASFNTYMGSYYPFNGSLEDFNMGSANGVWSLDIENLGDLDGNIEFFELIFCDPTGIDCEPCFLDAGDFQEEFFTTCQQDIRLRNLDAFLSPDFILNNTEQQYSYVLAQGDNIITIQDEILESDTLSAGTYTICGLAYQQIDTSTILSQNQVSDLMSLIDSNSICADLTSPCFTLLISAVDNLLRLDTSLCRGDTLEFFGIKVFDNLDTNILRTNQVTCDSLISITTRIIEPIADINTTSLLTTCGGPLFLDAAGSTTNGGNITYNWSTIDGNYISDIGPVAQVDTAGYYLLEILSDNCTDTIGVSVNSIDTFSLDYIIAAPICDGDTFFVSLDVNVDALLVDGPPTIDMMTQGFSTIEEGTYFLESQLGRCVRLDTITLIDTSTTIDLQIFSTIIDCDSTFSTTTVITNAVNPVFSYEGAEAITAMTSMVEISTPGIYSVTVTDDQGCTASQAFIVEGSADVPVFMTEDILIACNEPSPELPLQIVSMIDSLSWSGPGGFVSSEENPTVNDTGEYTVTVFAATGCTLSSTITYATFNVAPDLSIIGDTLRCNQDTALLCVDAQYQSIEWSLDNTILSTDSCIIADQTGSYIVNVLDINGCTGSGTYDLINIDFLDIIIDDLPDSLSITCADSTVVIVPIILSDTTGLSYSWIRDNNIISNEPQITVSNEGLYILEIVDVASGCTYSDTSIVSIIQSTLDPDIISIIADTIQCDRDSTSILINGIDLEAIHVYINQELIIDPFNIMLAEGEYELTFIDSLGCDITILQSIERLDAFTLDLGPDIIVGMEQSVDIEVQLSIPLTDVITYEWSDPDILDCTICLDPTITVSEETELSLTVIDNNGCVQSDNIIISVLDSISSTSIYAPNIFSPDAMGVNNRWQLYLEGGNTVLLELRIYDRWGNLVIFHSDSRTSEDFSWDGTYNGTEAEQGVYVYVAKYLDNTNREVLIQGQITLLR